MPAMEKQQHQSNEDIYIYIYYCALLHGLSDDFIILV